MHDIALSLVLLVNNDCVARVQVQFVSMQRQLAAPWISRYEYSSALVAPSPPSYPQRIYRYMSIAGHFWQTERCLNQGLLAG